MTSDPDIDALMAYSSEKPWRLPDFPTDCDLFNLSMTREEYELEYPE